MILIIEEDGCGTNDAGQAEGENRTEEIAVLAIEGEGNLAMLPVLVLVGLGVGLGLVFVPLVHACREIAGLFRHARGAWAAVDPGRIQDTALSLAVCPLPCSFSEVVPVALTVPPWLHLGKAMHLAETQMQSQTQTDDIAYITTVEVKALVLSSHFIVATCLSLTFPVPSLDLSPAFQVEVETATLVPSARLAAASNEAAAAQAKAASLSAEAPWWFTGALLLLIAWVVLAVRNDDPGCCYESRSSVLLSRVLLQTDSILRVLQVLVVYLLMGRREAGDLLEQAEKFDELVEQVKEKRSFFHGSGPLLAVSPSGSPIVSFLMQAHVIIETESEDEAEDPPPQQGFAKQEGFGESDETFEMEGMNNGMQVW